MAKKQTPILKPLYPSILDEWEEAQCRKCRDGGLIATRYVEHDGVYYAYTPCECQEGKLAKQREDASGIPERHLETCFETFIPILEAKDAFDAATSLAIGKANYKILLIYGGVGNGKTHLAYSAVVEACRLGIVATYVYAPDMFREIRSLFERSEDPTHNFKVSEFLVIDDLGAEHETEWTKSVFEEILDYRYSNELTTIVTTNKPPTVLSEPVLSRFTDQRISKLVENKAPDYRPKMRRQQ